jgi:two-component system sensor histidine kinase QseC
MVPDRAVWVHGHNTMLELALRNLIDNALRHNPAGTQVEVSVVQQAQGQVSVRVNDDGAAGPARTAVQPGMGIGLTLVRRIADWHGVAFEQQVGTAPFTQCYALSWRAAPTQSRGTDSDATPA